MPLSTLSPEIIHEILQYNDAIDISSLSRTSKRFYSLTDSDTNPVLWKTAFLQLFDAPESSARPGYPIPSAAGSSTSINEESWKLDYARLLKDRCRARGIAQCPHRDKKIIHRAEVLRTLQDILKTSSNSPSTLSKNAQFLSSLLASKASIEDWLIPPRESSRKKQKAPEGSSPRRRRRNVLVAVGGQVLVSQDVEDEDAAQNEGELESHVDEDEEAHYNGELQDPIQQRDTHMQSQSPCPLPAESVPGPSTPYPSSTANNEGTSTSIAGASTSPTSSPETPRSPKKLSIPDDPELANLSYYIHAHGLSKYEIDTLSYASGRYHREIVYKCTNFDQSNTFGPFVKRENSDQDLEVDWKILYSIVIVMALNVKSAWHQWAEPEEMSILPYGFKNAVMWKQPGPGRDWAGVEGSWSYVYSFIDYNDFFAYNFASDTLGAHHRNVVNNLEGVSEAVGGVNILTLHLDDEDPDSVDEDKAYDPYPELKFNGHSATPNNSQFTGTVKLLPSGDRHWTFIITYGGAERWITQGIEIGMRGIYGMWSDVLHEELSPCGPVWYFRD